MQSLTVVIVKVLSFNQMKWKANGGCSKHSETLAVLSSPHLHDTGNVIHCPFTLMKKERQRVQVICPKSPLKFENVDLNPGSLTLEHILIA